MAAILVMASVTTFGQAKKYPLFEHFTQASCVVLVLPESILPGSL